MSTILVLRVIGVAGCGRSVHSEDSGCTNLVRFSYSANKRSSFAGVFPSVFALLYVVSVDFSYLATAWESRCRIWYT